MLFLGRSLQAIAGCAGWVISFATIDDKIQPLHMSKALGIAFSFLTTAVLTGPAISGVLLQSSGYWAIWSVPLSLLVISFIVRLIMLEEDRLPFLPDETSSLLGSAKFSESSLGSGTGVCRVLLLDVNFLVGLLNIMMEGIISTGFDTTLPLYLQRQFGMGPAVIGSIFLAFQAAGVVISPLIGLLRNKMRLHFSTTLGWVIMAPLLWLLGTPGVGIFPNEDTDAPGKDIVVCCLICVGFAGAMTRGAGMLQMKGRARCGLLSYNLDLLIFSLRNW